MEQQQTRERRKPNWDRIGHAFLIGFLVGIAIFAAASGNFGFALLLPLYLAWLFLRKGKRGKDVDQEGDTQTGGAS